MATLEELKARAAEMGHKMTPQLKAELLMLSAIPDEVLRKHFEEAKRKAIVGRLADDFKVPRAAMAARLGIDNY